MCGSNCSLCGDPEEQLSSKGTGMCRSERQSPAAQMRTGFWDAPRRDNQSMEDVYLSCYTLTCRERTPIGLFPLNFRIAAARLKWDEQQLRTVMQRLTEQGEVLTEGSWIAVATWWDHNNKPGPGLTDRIREVVASAPSNLLDRWIKICAAEGVDTEPWFGEANGPQRQEQAIAPTTPPTTLPCSAPPTRPPLRTTTKSKHQVSKTTTTTTLDSIEILECAEEYRHILTDIATKYKLNETQTQHLAWELSQRLDNQNKGMVAPLNSVLGWIEHLATLQISGKEILNCGIPLKKARERKAAAELKKAEESQMKIQTKELEAQATEKTRTIFSKILLEASTELLDEIKAKVIAMAASQKHASEVIEKINQRTLAGDYAGALTIRAIKASLPNLEI